MPSKCWKRVVGKQATLELVAHSSGRRLPPLMSPETFLVVLGPTVRVEAGGGPVSATPTVGITLGPPEDEPSGDGASSPSRITYGKPESVSFRVMKQSGREVVLELETAGFYAEPQEDGTVKVEIPDYVLTTDEGVVSLPVRPAFEVVH